VSSNSYSSAGDQFYRPPSPIKRKKTPRIVILIKLAFYTMLILCLIAVPFYASGISVRPFGIPYYLIVIAAGSMMVAIACGAFKRKILRGMSETIDRSNVDLNDFPWIDANEFARYTAELQSMGFEWQCNYKRQMGAQKRTLNITTIFIHRGNKCFATVGQTLFRGAVKEPVQCGVISYSKENLRSNAKHWKVLTTNKKLSGAVYASRSPWSAVNSIANAGPAQLLQIHLNRRADVINGMDIPVEDDVSLDNIFAVQNVWLAQKRQKIRRRNTVLYVLEMDIFDFISPKSEWVGERVTLGSNAHA